MTTQVWLTSILIGILAGGIIVGLLVYLIDKMAYRPISKRVKTPIGICHPRERQPAQKPTMSDGLHHQTFGRLIRHITPKPKQIWEHYNGTLYEVIYIANTEYRTTKHPITVVYKGVTNGYVWTRELSDWHRAMSLVTVTKDERFKQFTLTGVESKDISSTIKLLEMLSTNHENFENFTIRYAYYAALDALRVLQSKLSEAKL